MTRYEDREKILNPSQLAVIDSICAIHKTNLSTLRTMRRAHQGHLKAIVKISKFLRDENWFLAEIANFLCRDHTTIMHHVRGKNG